MGIMEMKVYLKLDVVYVFMCVFVYMYVLCVLGVS